MAMGIDGFGDGLAFTFMGSDGVVSPGARRASAAASARLLRSATEAIAIAGFASVVLAFQGLGISVFLVPAENGVVDKSVSTATGTGTGGPEPDQTYQNRNRIRNRNRTGTKRS